MDDAVVVRLAGGEREGQLRAFGEQPRPAAAREREDEEMQFVYEADEEPLTAEHGGPVRLVVPSRYFWKSAKWLNGIELVPADRPGFWERYGYHNDADYWKEERYAF